MARRACAMTLLRAQMASIMRPADGTPQQVWAPSREKTFSLSSPKPRPKLLKTHHSPDPEDTSGLDHTALYTAGFCGGCSVLTSLLLIYANFHSGKSFLRQENDYNHPIVISFRGGIMAAQPQAF